MPSNHVYLAVLFSLAAATLALSACRSQTLEASTTDTGSGVGGGGADGGGCSVEDGCQRMVSVFTCADAPTPAAMCEIARSNDSPNLPDGYQGSRAEGCGYVSYSLGDWTGGVVLHYEAATGKLVGLQIRSEDPNPACGARFGTVVDPASCPGVVVCGRGFVPADAPCDWAALCGP